MNQKYHLKKNLSKSANQVTKIENLAQNPRLRQVLFTKKNLENIIDYFSVQFTLYNVYLFYVNSKGPKYYKGLSINDVTLF